MATYYKTDGSVEEVKPKNGKAFSYQELSDFVKLDDNNHMVEIVPMPSGKFMVVNEEGKLIGLPKNEKATEVWKAEYPIGKYPINNDELIVGNALIATDDEINGGE